MSRGGGWFFAAAGSPAMEKRKRVLELRERMDRTLALPDLAEESSLRALVKKQMQASALTGSDEGAGPRLCFLLLFFHMVDPILE